MKERKVILLEACRNLLRKQSESQNVLDLLSETINYDGAECDGKRLLEDIEHELELSNLYLQNTLDSVLKQEVELQKITLEKKLNIEKTKWNFIKEKYNLYEGCICKVNENIVSVHKIKTMYKSYIALSGIIIKKDGNIGKTSIIQTIDKFTFLFSNYEEYRKNTKIE